MRYDLLDGFEWVVDVTGYAVATEVPSRPVPIFRGDVAHGWMNSPAKYVVRKSPRDDRKKIYPFRSRVLDRFLAIELGDEDGLVAFTRRFGLLWRTRAIALLIMKDTQNPFLAAGDPRAWQAPDRASRKNLSRNPSWQADWAPLYEVNAVRIVFRHLAEMKEVLALFSGERKISDPKSRATFIQMKVDSHLRANPLEVRLHRRGSELDFVARPESLLSALWIQLAINVSRESNLLHCVHCNSLFTTQVKSRGVPRRFCSDRCNKANQRARRRQDVSSQ